MTHDMTYDRTNPPPDDLMAKVLAPFYGFDTIEAWTETMDPRVCTDAALELLHHLVNLSPYGRLDCVLGGWDLADENDTRAFLPLSSEPFRTGVAWLAVDVLGVG